MPQLDKPCVCVPWISTAQEKKNCAIYVRIIENRGTPSTKFLTENPDYKS